MRLSSLVVAAILFFSAAVLAQHSSTSSSSSGASGGGSHASASGGASSSHGSSSHSSSSHSSSSASAGSHPAGGHSSPGGSAAASRGSSHGTAGSAAVSRSKAAPPVPAKNDVSPTKAALPERHSFFSFLRHPFSKGKAKPVDSNLRRPICKEGPCEKPKPPVTLASDLRPPICKGKDCHCPSGVAPGKNGSCVEVPTNTTCSTGQIWNGTACTTSTAQCPANEYWNGATCVSGVNQCATIDSRAAALANEVRSAKSQMQNACLNNSPGQDCDGLRLSYDGAVERYRMLENEAPANCRNMLADPLSF